MQAAFEDACVTGYAGLVESMTNDRKDRHVLAAAVRAGAHAILTENVKHFPSQSVASYIVEVLTPGQFPAHQFHLNRELLEEKFYGGEDTRNSIRRSRLPAGEVGAITARTAPGFCELREVQRLPFLLH